MEVADSEQLSYVEELLSKTVNFKWPEQVFLYCLPPEKELLVDTACRLVFQSYLRLSRLKFATKIAINAKSMSPDATTPFLVFQMKDQPMIWTDFDQLVCFLNRQGLGIGSDLEELDQVDQEAYLSLLKMRILPAQHHQTWANRANLKETLKTAGYGLSWPLGDVLPFFSLARYAWSYWENFSRPRVHVLKDFEMVCNALSLRLGKQEYFFQGRPTPLDVTVYGHLQATVSVPLQSAELVKIVQQHENLTAFCQRMTEHTTIRQ